MYLKDVWSLLEEQLAPDTMFEFTWNLYHENYVKRFLYSQMEYNQHFQMIIVRNIDYMICENNKLKVVDIIIHNAYDLEYLNYIESGC